MVAKFLLPLFVATLFSRPCLVSAQGTWFGHGFDLQSGWLGDPLTGLCYTIPPSLLTQPQAQASCINRGGRLAEFHNQSQLAFVDTLFKGVNISVWIGASDGATECKTVWASNGAAVRNSSWMPGQPDDIDCVTNTPGNPPLPQQDCVQAMMFQYWTQTWLSSFQWDDHGCNYNKRFLCQRSNQLGVCQVVYSNLTISWPNATSSTIASQTSAATTTKASSFPSTTSNIVTSTVSSTASSMPTVTSTMQSGTTAAPTASAASAGSSASPNAVFPTMCFSCNRAASVTWCNALFLLTTVYRLLG